MYDHVSIPTIRSFNLPLFFLLGIVNKLEQYAIPVAGKIFDQGINNCILLINCYKNSLFTADAMEVVQEGGSSSQSVDSRSISLPIDTGDAADIALLSRSVKGK
jgi:hypothetical protein